LLDYILIERFLIALLLGAAIGLEREFQHQREKTKDFAGFRTFILIAIFGALIGYISEQIESPALIIASLVSFMLLVIAGYVIVSIDEKRIGATTEMSAIITFVLGILVLKGHIIISVIIAIIVAALLAYKLQMHKFARKIEAVELYSTLKFALISLVVLPLLPNKGYTLLDIPVLHEIIESFPSVALILAQIDVLNPFKIWLMVVFIAGISFVGYILIKTVGAKAGLGLTGFMGGLISSTAVTSSLAIESKRAKKIVNVFVFGTIIASCTMYFRVLFEVLVLNKSLLKHLIVPIGLMAVVGLGYCLYLYLQKKKTTKNTKHFEFNSPFALGPALKFGLFFGFVLYIAKLFQILFGDTGIYIASLVSGLADVDAITITMASLANTGDVTSVVAVSAITIAVCSNTVVKGGIAYLFGAKEFGMIIMKVFGAMLAVALIAILIM
jgi:uncharacterized membrane protein (DUF4010 family)